ncbi:MAG: Na+/H+ antiporter NhaC family protein [Candidatus Undinarchaeales archaeon]
MDPILSLVPAIVAIVLAMSTKRIIPSLLVGLFAGSFLLSPGILAPFSKTLEYMIATLTNSGNLQVILFLYLFSGLVGLIKFSGGVEGFSNSMLRFVKSRKQFLLSIWGLLPLTFIDCGFRVVSGGAITKDLADKFKLSRAKLAVLLNFTASPVISLIPIATTFVGYMVGLLGIAFTTAGITGSPYITFLQSIPFNFFSIILIIILFATVVTGKGIASGKNIKFEPSKKPENKDKIWNLVLPIILLIFLSFFLMYKSGADAGGKGLLDVFSKSNSFNSMLLALFITLTVSFAFFLFQKFSAKEMVENIISHGNKIMQTIAILAVAWPIASVSKDLGLQTLVSSVSNVGIPPAIIAFLIFAITSAVAFAIGSSWGTWALMMPVGVSLAAATGSSIPMVAGAVWAGGTFGDVTSPLSGMTNMAANVTGTSYNKYFKKALPYALAAFLLSLVFYLVFGFIL